MKTALIPAALLALTLAACGTADGDQADAPPRSERGNIIKAIGQQAGVTGQCAQDCVNFTVTDIATAPACDNPLEPIDGRLLSVTLDITTQPDAPKDDMTGMFQTFNWAVVDGAGTTHSNGSGELMSPCLDDANAIGAYLSPGSHYTGTLLFDVPADSKILVLDMFGQASWEWNIPE